MSNVSGTLRNVDSIATPKQGEFHPGTPRTVPTTQSHKPGTKVKPEDNEPVFHAETVPPGTAPRESVYVPHPNDSGSQALNPNVERGHGKESVKTTAGQSLTGSTSQTVNTGIGKPTQGQTSTEIRHDGEHGRKNPGVSLEGVGASKPDRFERDMPSQRGYERDDAQSGNRGDKGAFAAEERNPEPPGTLASEWKYEPGTKR